MKQFMVASETLLKIVSRASRKRYDIEGVKFITVARTDKNLAMKMYPGCEDLVRLVELAFDGQ